MSETTDRKPSAFNIFRERYPEVGEAYAAMGDAAYRAGPLSDRETRLVKLALAIGSGHEGGVHSHVRRGLREGLSPEELRHVALLALSSQGLSVCVSAMSWIDDIAEQ